MDFIIGMVSGDDKERQSRRNT